uniref:Uncharacterized protein n=1 Tax=Rhizophora mucronata TaxID=61149 RepID=A0A2P2P890_RHIMU
MEHSHFGCFVVSCQMRVSKLPILVTDMQI